MGGWIAVSIALLVTTRNKMTSVTVVLVTGKNSLVTGEYMVNICLVTERDTFQGLQTLRWNKNSLNITIIIDWPFQTDSCTGVSLQVIFKWRTSECLYNSEEWVKDEQMFQRLTFSSETVEFKHIACKYGPMYFFLEREVCSLSSLLVSIILIDSWDTLSQSTSTSVGQLNLWEE